MSPSHRRPSVARFRPSFIPRPGRHTDSAACRRRHRPRHEFARNTGRAPGDLVGVDLAISFAETLKNVIERDEQLKVIQRSFIWYDGVDGGAHTVRAIMALSFAAPSRH